MSEQPFTDVEKGPPNYESTQQLDSADTALHEQPPSYDSLFGKIKAAHETSDNKISFAKTSWGLISTSVGFIVCLGITLCLPIAHVIIGSVFLHDCTIQRFIPIYLVVGGACALIQNLVGLVNKIKDRGQGNAAPQEERETTPAEKATNCFNSLFSCFMFAWFIADISNTTMSGLDEKTISTRSQFISALQSSTATPSSFDQPKYSTSTTSMTPSTESVTINFTSSTISQPASVTSRPISLPPSLNPSTQSTTVCYSTLGSQSTSEVKVTLNDSSSVVNVTSDSKVTTNDSSVITNATSESQTDNVNVSKVTEPTDLSRIASNNGKSWKTSAVVFIVCILILPACLLYIKYRHKHRVKCIYVNSCCDSESDEITLFEYTEMKPMK